MASGTDDADGSAPRTTAAATGSTMIRMRDIRKVYSTGRVEVLALRGIDLDVGTNEYLAIVGPSGSGKSTLMNILGCLDRPTSGHYYLDGQDVSQLPDDELSEFRGRRLGFIFQNFNLIPQLTVLENLEVPLFYQGVKPALRRQRAHELCHMVGLESRGTHRPVELSGGQQQRVAVARALMNNPIFLLADEPTGNLDSKTGEAILEMFHDLHARQTTLVIVTHDPHVGAQCARRVVLKDGLVEHDLRQKPLRGTMS